jgi:outer membrane protein TolC
VMFWKPDGTRRLCVAGARMALLWTALAAAPAAAQEPPRVLSLEQVVRIAVERDPAAVAAEASLSNARTDVLQAAGSWLPNLSVGSSYANSSNQRFDQSTGRLVSESYTAQLQGSYEIFTGGRRLLN